MWQGDKGNQLFCSSLAFKFSLHRLLEAGSGSDCPSELWGVRHVSAQ